MRGDDGGTLRGLSMFSGSRWWQLSNGKCGDLPSVNTRLPLCLENIAGR